MMKYILTWSDDHEVCQEIFDTQKELKAFIEDSCVGRDSLSYIINEIFLTFNGKFDIKTTERK